MTRSIILLRLVAVPAASLVAALVVGACGSEDPNPPTTGTGGSSGSGGAGGSGATGGTVPGADARTHGRQRRIYERWDRRFGR